MKLSEIRELAEQNYHANSQTQKLAEITLKLCELVKLANRQTEDDYNKRHTNLARRERWLIELHDFGLELE